MYNMLRIIITTAMECIVEAVLVLGNFHIRIEPNANSTKLVNKLTSKIGRWCHSTITVLTSTYLKCKSNNIKIMTVLKKWRSLRGFFIKRDCFTYAVILMYHKKIIFTYHNAPRIIIIVVCYIYILLYLRLLQFLRF